MSQLAGLPEDDGDDLDAESETAVLRPQDSQITIERFPDGLTINVPPAGLWRGTQGLFFFALLFNGIVVFVAAALLAIFLGGGKPADPKALFAMPAFLSLFVLVGIGLMLGAINMGRRRAAIAVTGGTLMVIQTGIFGSKQRNWPADDVESILAGPSGMTVNDRPILELQILSRSSEKFGLLAGRCDDELRWLASELRTALKKSQNVS